MAFTAKILSWRFRHLNIVGCLLKRRPTKGGGGGHGHPRTPLATPLHKVHFYYQDKRKKDRKRGKKNVRKCKLLQYKVT